ncbi:MAG: hypothetical protein JF609_10030, partial [Verrucomicrobia bacterium]|nr:hypothetical protein [Verrucomicrobiota bacterium]
MRKLIKHIFWAVLVLAMSHQSALAFAFLGPRNNAGGLDGDSNWEIPLIGHALPGDVGTVKNIGEEWRRVTPVMYYASDASFLGFFGQVGLTNIDTAFAIMNGAMAGQTNAQLFMSTATNGILSSSINNPYAGVSVILAPTNNLNRYPADLPDFPLESQQINYSAQALNLTDLRSYTLMFLTEQMGLAEPERFAWTLHDRFLNAIPGASCTKGDELYFVVQRNFDVIDTPLNQVQYSPYVNGTLYTYEISEFCATAFPATTVPIAVDIFADTFTAVASFGLFPGGFYTSMTRDDVAGLRYLMSTNNVNFEQTAPSGGLLLTTNLPSPELITTLSYGLFISQLTNDPATLQALYPNLQITSTTTNFALTNITVITPTYTNFPGQTVTNFLSPNFYVVLTNYDLALFSSLVKTSSPAALLTLYPQLDILSSTVVGITNIPIPNVVTYLTNYVGSPVGSPPIQVTVTNSFSPNFYPVYNYTFGNIVTNVFSTSNKVVIQTISVTNVTGSPFGTPQSTNITTVNKTITNGISGDFFIIPTNWCGYQVFSKIFEQKTPSFTNALVAATTTNALGVAQFTQNTISFYTNRIWAFLPGVCEPALIYETNQLSLVLTNYQYVFGNLFKDPPTHQFNNTTVIVTVTNIGATATNQAGTLTTNVVTTTNVIAGLPSGDFFIIPAAWTCGFAIQQVVATNQVGTTNTVLTPVPPGVLDIGQQFSTTTISTYTNHVLLIQPYICQLSAAAPALRQGIGRVVFIRANYDSLLGRFFQPQTNDYTMVKVVNSQMVTEYYRRVITTPDFLMRAEDLTSGPPDTTHGTGSAARSLTFDDRTAIIPNLAGPGT